MRQNIILAVACILLFLLTAIASMNGDDGAFTGFLFLVFGGGAAWFGSEAYDEWFTVKLSRAVSTIKRREKEQEVATAPNIQI